MNTDANKQLILANIRRGVTNPELMADRSRKLAVFEPSPFEPAALVARWREEFEALTGVAYGPLSPDAAMAQLVELVARFEPQAAIAWADADLPLPGVSQRLQAAGISVEYIDDSATDLAVRQRLEKISVGITGVVAGLADTGSMVVDTSAGRSRAASLLPPVHIALLPVSALYPDLPTWMALQGGDMLASTANITVISGPSKTADIELNLVLGVHGPGEVYVILVE